MEALPASARITVSPLVVPLSIFSSSRKSFPRRPLLLPISSKSRKDEHDMNSDAKDAPLVPLFKNPSSFSPLSKDEAMGLVLSAASGRGWTTGSGMEGPASPEADSGDRPVSTFPWSLFTKSPRRRMRVAFTCSVCGQRTTRAINPHAYTEGTVFVQCSGCSVFHKLVDNLNLFDGMKCYVNPSFWYKEDAHFKFLDGDDDNGNTFPIL